MCLCTNVYVQIQYVLCFFLLDVGHLRYCKQYVEQLLDCEPHVNGESQHENQISSSSETITSLIVTITRINLVLHQWKSVESRKTIYALRFKVLLASASANIVFNLWMCWLFEKQGKKCLCITNKLKGQFLVWPPLFFNAAWTLLSKCFYNLSK